MILNQVWQQSRWRQHRLQIIRTHLEAFDVEQVFPIPLFEEAALEIQGSCGVEPSCKVKGNQLFGGRFEICNDSDVTWPECLGYTHKFLDQVESYVEVSLNRQAFEQFSTIHLNSKKIINNTIGIHIDSQLKKSRVTLYFHLEIDTDPEELVRTAIALDGGGYSEEWTQILIRDTVIIAFELLFDGRSVIEIWPAASAKPEYFRNKGQYLIPYVNKKLSPRVNFLFRNSKFILISYPKFSSEPMIWFYFHDEILDSISKLFLFNGLGDRVYNFLKNQNCIIADASIAANAKEFEKSRLDNFCFYYTMRDSCQPHLP